MTSPTRAEVTGVETWPVRFRTTGFTPSVLRLSKNAVQAVSSVVMAVLFSFPFSRKLAASGGRENRPRPCLVADAVRRLITVAHWKGSISASATPVRARTTSTRVICPSVASLIAAALASVRSTSGVVRSSMPAAQHAVTGSTHELAASPVEQFAYACIVNDNVSPGVVPLATSRYRAIARLRDVEQAQLL